LDGCALNATAAASNILTSDKENFYKFLNASYKTAKETYTVEN
jgi:hypothetical protein